MNPTRPNNQESRVAPMAASVGLDREFVGELVDTFYSHIREHKSLAPIFNQHIADWDEHLPKMKDFWASVALGQSGYSGRPMPAHIRLRDEVTAEHFVQWLALFEKTLGELTSSEELIQHFMIRARRIAQSLQNAMFGQNSSLPQM